jgi:hypothetical protein
MMTHPSHRNMSEAVIGKVSCKTDDHTESLDYEVRLRDGALMKAKCDERLKQVLYNLRISKLTTLQTDSFKSLCNLTRVGSFNSIWTLHKISKCVLSLFAYITALIFAYCR